MAEVRILVKLESKTPSELTKTIPLPAKIGRRIGNKVVPSESNGVYESQVLSRNHAEIYLEGGKVLLKDLESSNGTFLGGERVSKPTELKDGALIEFGVVVYDDDGETVKHDKVSVVAQIIEQNEAEVLPDVVVRSLPPNVNLKSEETQELLLQSVLAILLEESKKQVSIDLTLQELNEVLEAGELQFKGPEPVISSDTIKLQREMRVCKKKIADLEAQVAGVAAAEEENQRLKKELEEKQAGLIRAQKEGRVAAALSDKVVALEKRLAEEAASRKRQEQELAQKEEELSRLKKRAPEAAKKEADPSLKKKLDEEQVLLASLTRRNEELEAENKRAEERILILEYEVEALRHEYSPANTRRTPPSNPQDRRKSSGAVLSSSSSAPSLISPSPPPTSPLSSPRLDERKLSAGGSPTPKHISSKIRNIQILFEKGSE